MDRTGFGLSFFFVLRLNYIMEMSVVAGEYSLRDSSENSPVGTKPRP